jgi:hypothetical protein
MRPAKETLMHRLTTSFVAGLLILGANSTRGDLFVHEPFDYSPVDRDLVGTNGGLGFAGPWQPGGFNASISDNVDVDDDPLAFGALLSSPSAVRTSAVGAISGVTRSLAVPLGEAETTVYLSFLIKPEGVLHAGAFNGFLGVVLESPGEPELFIGKPGGGATNRWVLEDRGGSLQHASPVDITTSDTALLVVKAEYAGVGDDRFTLYVNPTPGAPEPATGIVKNDADFGLVQGLTIYSTGAMRIDELRVGQTFADVTPIPEPTSLGLAALAVFALRRTERRRSVSRQ